MTDRPRHPKGGFTLLEILVVVVILGILAAILFPIFARARGAAEKASCLVHQKELALAAVMYQQDHDDRLYPFGYYEGSSFVTWWGDLNTGEPSKGFLFPYTKSGHIRGCPSAIDLPTPPYFYRMGYGVNFRLFFRYPPEVGEIEFRTVSGSEIDRPAETLYSADAAAWNEEEEHAIGSAWLFGDAWNNHLQSRHAGNLAVVTWLDGHATAHPLYYHVAPQGSGSAQVQPEKLRAFRLGDLLKFPRENPQAPSNSERDQFYFLLKKPAGT